jgi:hypothetical protein
MAKMVFKNGFISVNGVDISDHVTEVTIDTSRDEVDVTAMGSTNREFVAGLGDATISITAFQDFAAAEIDATMWPLSTTDTPFPVSVRPVNGAISATNPEYQMTALLFAYTPISGGVGSAMSTPLTFRNASPTGLVRDTTP